MPKSLAKMEPKLQVCWAEIRLVVAADLLLICRSNSVEFGCQTLLQTEGLYCRNFAATDANLLYAQSSDLQIFNSKFSSFC